MYVVNVSYNNMYKNLMLISDPYPVHELSIMHEGDSFEKHEHVALDVSLGEWAARTASPADTRWPVCRLSAPV